MMQSLIIILAIGLVGCGEKPVIYKAGTYEGSAEGHIGLIKVQIVTDEYEIKKINILEQQETPVLADIVYEKIPSKVIKANSTDVEVVAGATYTSNGLINAIGNGLDKAHIEK